MVLKKTVTDVNGGDVNPGDVLQYEISSTNTGSSTAYDSRIDDAIPAHTAFRRARSRSSRARAASPATRPTRPTSTRPSSTRRPNAVRFRVGTGAGALGAARTDGGGMIAPGESFKVRFNVVVGADVPDGTQILNTAILSSKDENGIDYTSVASAPAAVTVHGVPDVTIDKSHTGAFVRGAQGTFSLLVSNVGGRATTGAVVIDDTLPAGLGSRQRRRHRLVVLGRRAPPTRCTAIAPTRSLRARRTRP